MNKPSRSSMEAYLRQMGMTTLPENPNDLEREYYRQIYRVLPREAALALPIKTVRSQTSIHRHPKKKPC